MIGKIVLLPFLAQGHFNAFVNFANFVHKHHPSCIITMVSTPLNTAKIRSMLLPSNQINFTVLPFDPTAHGLPPDGECTDVLPPHLINRLVGVTHTLQPALEQELSDLVNSADRSQGICLISDVFCSWAADVAEKLSIFHVVLSTCGAFGTAFSFTVWLNLPHLNSSSDEFELPGWPGMRLHRSQLNDNVKAATATDMCTVAYRSIIRSSLRSSGMLVNSVEEIETKGMKRLRFLYGDKPVWGIGPLIFDSILSDANEKSSLTLDTKQRRGKKQGVSDEDCTKWLDQHPPGSVLYVSFGSQITISSSQMRELASGLEESGKSFIWVVRPPSEFKLEEEFRASEWLPAGFEERMRERNQGLVVRNWAPQLIILSHESTGAFLSHCGWNSVLESLGNGVPIICWPQAAEQFYNAKMMVEEMGVCIELARGNKANIKSEEVAKVASLVTGSESAKGKELRRNAAQVREKMMRAVRGRKKDSPGADDGDNSLESSISALNSFMEMDANPYL